MMKEVLAVFPTTHLTLVAEKTFQGAGIAFRTILKPRKISSDCGLAIRLGEEALEQAAAAVRSSGPLPASFYRSEGGEWRQVLTVTAAESAGGEGGRS